MKLRTLPLSALIAALPVGCGAPPAQVTGPSPPVEVDPPHALVPPPCTTEHCEVVSRKRVGSMEVDPKGLRMNFEPGVLQRDAVHAVFHCQLTGGPEQPELPPGLVCPLDLGAVKIDVGETPAGTSLLIHTGSVQQSEALRQWYSDHLR